MTTVDTRRLLPGEKRCSHTNGHFGLHLPMQLEPTIFSIAPVRHPSPPGVSRLIRPSCRRSEKVDFSGGGGRANCGNITLTIGSQLEGESGMHRLLSRTSITIDEAVGILVGLIRGPVDFDRSDGPEDVDADCLMFCLEEALDNEMAVPASEYVMAKYEKQPAHVIAEKLAAQQRREAMIERANYYKCAIADELNKREQSVLKKDLALTNDAYTFITLHSFNEWVTSRESVAGGQPSATVPAASIPVSVQGKEKKAPRTKGLQQEEAILNEIRRQGEDPAALPKNPSGKPGVKAAVYEALKNSPLFVTFNVFDTAWQRLLTQKLTAYKAAPSSP